ncbi:MAG: hypothetical protein P4L48_00565 [Mycobacterium sp.]|nr:hypothetical protein [Mycobacterium sp.]
MTSVEALAVHRRCVERIEGAWAAFLARRRELLAQAERFGSAPEKATEWIPPPQLDRGARTNDYHHPERLFDDDEAP